MNVVVDTNVLVSGLLSPFSPPGEIVRMVSSGDLRLCLDGRLLAEYSAVLRRPRLQFDAELVAAFLEQIERGGVLVAGIPLRRPLPDADDSPFLEVALAADVQCLVTGNLRHYPSASRQEITVLSPKQFLDFHRKHTASLSKRLPKDRA